MTNDASHTGSAALNGSGEGPFGSLAGVRVVEAATVLAAPLAGMMLADHGADVIKVESPAGDPLRGWGYARGETPLFWKMVARNKRLVTLDLHAAEAQEILLSLLAETDVFIENFRPGTLDRWGLTTERIFAANPKLVLLRVSGFGQTGPYSSRPGFGTLAEAFSGFAYINGWADKPPTLPPFGLADSLAGFVGAFGVVAALRAADVTGRGQVVDTSLFEPMLTALGSIVIDFDQLGIVQQRTGNMAPFTAPRNAYRTADDRWIAMSCGTQSTVHRLFEAIGRPELASDPRFTDNQARISNVEDLDKFIATWMRSYDAEDALDHLMDAGVPAVVAASVDDIVEDPHVKARGSVVSVSDDDLGDVRLQAPVPRLSDTPAHIRHLGGDLGQHNEEVYSHLGLTRDRMAELRANKII